MEEKPKPEQTAKPWGDAAWVLAMGSQAGLMLACPVLGALAVGYLVDRQLGTLPVITLILTFIGMIAGPVLVYRWVTRAVAARTGQTHKRE